MKLPKKLFHGKFFGGRLFGGPTAGIGGRHLIGYPRLNTNATVAVINDHADRMDFERSSAATHMAADESHLTTALLQTLPAAC